MSNVTNMQDWKQNRLDKSHTESTESIHEAVLDEIFGDTFTEIFGISWERLCHKPELSNLEYRRLYKRIKHKNHDIRAQADNGKLYSREEILEGIARTGGNV